MVRSGTMVANATNCCCIFSRRLRSETTCSGVLECDRLRLSGGTPSTVTSGQASPPDEKLSVLAAGSAPKESMVDDDGCPPAGSFLIATGLPNDDRFGNAGVALPSPCEPVMAGGVGCRRGSWNSCCIPA